MGALDRIRDLEGTAYKNQVFRFTEEKDNDIKNDKWNKRWEVIGIDPEHFHTLNEYSEEMKELIAAAPSEIAFCSSSVNIIRTDLIAVNMSVNDAEEYRNLMNMKQRAAMIYRGLNKDKELKESAYNMVKRNGDNAIYTARYNDRIKYAGYNAEQQANNVPVEEWCAEIKKRRSERGHRFDFSSVSGFLDSLFDS
jgi:hypothetical protein